MSVDLSVILPARNEARRLPAALAAICAWAADSPWSVELIVADDHSSDRTVEFARAGGAGVVAARGRGKGAAVRAGMLAASGRWRLFTDTDLSTPIGAGAALVDALDAGADVAIGTRHVLSTTPCRALMGAVFRRCVRAAGVGAFADTQCGFKAFRADAAEAVFGRSRVDGMAFDVEVLSIAARQGLRIAEVPVPWTHDRDSRVRASDPARMLLDLGRVRLRAWRGDYDAVKFAVPSSQTGSGRVQ
jgi:dolichyl-phosphate beta-glucosyltransferase